MTDASGTGKSTPKTAVTATTDADTEEKKEKPVKEVPVIHDQGFFLHSTGDTYDGSFEAKKKDHSVKMHGQGVYTTAEGDIYTGFWEADRLYAYDGTTVSFNDGAKYEGILKDWCYSGKGTYTYPDGSVLKGDFADNCPVGNLVLTDPNGHTWLGKTEQGFGWFEPVNHFYELLETTQMKVKRRHKVAQPMVDTMPSIPHSTLAAKSKMG